MKFGAKHEEQKFIQKWRKRKMLGKSLQFFLLFMMVKSISKSLSKMGWLAKNSKNCGKN
jgi:hypothetical protein